MCDNFFFCGGPIPLLRALKQSLVRVERLLQVCGWLHVWRRLVLLLLAVANVTSAPPLQAHRVTDLCTDVAALAPA